MPAFYFYDCSLINCNLSNAINQIDDNDCHCTIIGVSTNDSFDSKSFIGYIHLSMSRRPNDFKQCNFWTSKIYSKFKNMIWSFSANLLTGLSIANWNNQSISSQITCIDTKSLLSSSLMMLFSWTYMNISS